MKRLAGHLTTRTTQVEAGTHRASRCDLGVHWGIDLTGQTEPAPRLAVWFHEPRRAGFAYLFTDPVGPVMAAWLEPAWLAARLSARTVLDAPPCPACVAAGGSSQSALYLVTTGGHRFFGARCHLLAEVPALAVPSDRAVGVPPAGEPGGTLVNGEMCDRVECTGVLLGPASLESSLAPLSCSGLFNDERGRARGWAACDEGVYGVAHGTGPTFASRTVAGRLYRGLTDPLPIGVAPDLERLLAPVRASAIRHRVRGI